MSRFLSVQRAIKALPEACDIHGKPLTPSQIPCCAQGREAGLRAYALAALADMATEPRRTFIVTIRRGRNPNHDPHNKVTGSCPLEDVGACTDQTGEHHSYLVTDWRSSASELVDKLRQEGIRVTRVEEIASQS